MKEMAKEITNIVKVFLELVYQRATKEIANIVKVFLEFVYQRWLRRSPIL